MDRSESDSRYAAQSTHHPHTPLLPYLGLPMNGSSTLRFLADKMLGSLTKKLRLLGINTGYLNAADEGELKYIARSQSRIILTRNRKLADSLDDGAWLVSGSGAREEFLSIASKLQSDDCRPVPFSLCLDCNERLLPVDPVETESKIPPYVLGTKIHFSKCASCGKVFWEGTHRKRMEEDVEWMREKLRNT